MRESLQPGEAAGVAERLPRIIWTLWYQGFDRAPDLVQRCLASWRDKNPGWKVIALDQDSLASYVDLAPIVDVDRKDVGVIKISNILRLNLLDRFGGVWVDATCFCCQPLDEWIDHAAGSGFFAFFRPGPERLMSTWFLASRPGNYLTRTLCAAQNRFWNKHRFRRTTDPIRRGCVSVLRRSFNRDPRRTRWWFHPIVLRILRVYPYFTFHYLFASLVWSDARYREIWNRTPKISAEGPHSLGKKALFRPVTEGARRDIDAVATPVYKLSWRQASGEIPVGSTLDYLMRRHGAVAVSPAL